MVRLGDLARRGAIPVLAELGRKGHLEMGDFVTAAEVTFDAAKRLRLDLKALGLLTVEETEKQGAMQRVVIRLTPVGQGVASRLVELDEYLQSQSRRK